MAFSTTDSNYLSGYIIGFYQGNYKPHYTESWKMGYSDGKYDFENQWCKYTRQVQEARVEELRNELRPYLR